MPNSNQLSQTLQIHHHQYILPMPMQFPRSENGYNQKNNHKYKQAITILYCLPVQFPCMGNSSLDTYDQISLLVSSSTLVRFRIGEGWVRLGEAQITLVRSPIFSSLSCCVCFGYFLNPSYILTLQFTKLIHLVKDEEQITLMPNFLLTVMLCLRRAKLL